MLLLIGQENLIVTGTKASYVKVPARSWTRYSLGSVLAYQEWDHYSNPGLDISNKTKFKNYFFDDFFSADCCEKHWEKVKLQGKVSQKYV